MDFQNTYTAFDNHKLFTKGSLAEVVTKIKRQLGKTNHSSILIFSDISGKTMDFNFQGTEDEVHKRLEIFNSEFSPNENTGPGRPKLGVVSREVSLLPRHWEWLATQSGGASATLRKLIDDAKKKSLNVSQSKQAQDRTYQVMSVLAGDLKGYEETLRALYKKDKKKFLTLIEAWPRDIQLYITELAGPVFYDNRS